MSAYKFSNTKIHVQLIFNKGSMLFIFDPEGQTLQQLFTDFSMPKHFFQPQPCEYEMFKVAMKEVLLDPKSELVHVMIPIKEGKVLHPISLEPNPARRQKAILDLFSVLDYLISRSKRGKVEFFTPKKFKLSKGDVYVTMVDGTQMSPLVEGELTYIPLTDRAMVYMTRNGSLRGVLRFDDKEFAMELEKAAEIMVPEIASSDARFAQQGEMKHVACDEELEISIVRNGVLHARLHLKK